jgi:CHASE3 domain sensor protein
MKTEEDEAFEELEFRLSKKDIQRAMSNLDKELEIFRNETIEEIAQSIEKFTAFGQDTIDSFAAYIRSQKRG